MSANNIDFDDDTLFLSSAIYVHCPTWTNKPAFWYFLCSSTQK